MSELPPAQHLKEGSSHPCPAVPSNALEEIARILLQDERARLGRPVCVLEVGSRAPLAACLQAMAECHYQHQKTESLTLLSDSRRFVGSVHDVVVVSGELGRHDPDDARRLLAVIGEHLRPGGTLWLLENSLVPLSLPVRDEGTRRWLHSIPALLGQGWDIQLLRDVAGGDAYLCRHGAGSPRVQLLQRAGGKALKTPLTDVELEILGAPALRAWAERVRPVVLEDEPARVHSLESQLRSERDRAIRQRRLADLAATLGSLRDSRFEKSARHGPRATPSHKHRSRGRALLIDDPFDTVWAHPGAGFEQVLHVFHQEWHGVRAAAGYSPGRKLAIPAERRLDNEHHAEVVRFCATEEVRVAVFHGFSQNAEELATALRKALGDSLKILAIYHGSSAQFHHEFEHRVFARLVALERKGIFDRVGCVKPDMHLLAPEIHPQVLLNLPPRITEPKTSSDGPQEAAFIPVPNDWRKNFFTNLYAAERSKRLRKIFVTTRFPKPRQLPVSKAVLVERPERTLLFRLLGRVDIILNATLSECQPMTALEGLALGVPCVTGPLCLGHLDDHPYQRLCQVAGVDTLGSVQAGVERLLDLVHSSPNELRQMMSDYQSSLVALAMDRYHEFLET